MSVTYISTTLRQLVTERAKSRCEYCQTQILIVGMPLEVEHIVPEIAGGESNEDNLCLACPGCNRYKGTSLTVFDPLRKEEVPLYHPRQQQWEDHFSWQQNGLIIEGLTTIGRATVEALQLNNPFVVRSRQVWIVSGWHPPQD